MEGIGRQEFKYLNPQRRYFQQYIVHQTLKKVEPDISGGGV